MQSMFSHGRLGNTGYLSILPVDQGIEHSAGASFAPNPIYFDPENIVRLAIEGGCNAVASTFGVLASVAREVRAQDPVHREVQPQRAADLPEQVRPDLLRPHPAGVGHGRGGRRARRSTSARIKSTRQITEVSEAFEEAHELGLATILWCYTRNNAFKAGGVDYHTAADLTGQANHLGATIGADIIKQKLPENNGGYKALRLADSSYGKLDERMYTELASDHPIDLTRYQVLNNYMGRIGLINSGGPSGKNDVAEAVKTAVINKRAGGMGLISGRKAFQKPMAQGVEILNAIQDVYLCQEVTHRLNAGVSPDASPVTRQLRVLAAPMHRARAGMERPVRAGLPDRSRDLRVRFRAGGRRAARRRFAASVSCS